MTKKEYLVFHEDFCRNMMEITKKKNSDYTGLSDDPFQNFKACEMLMIASTMQGFLVRMTDKLARINSFAQKGHLLVSDETVNDTLLDLANYSVLMAGFIRSQITRDLAKIQNHAPDDLKDI